MVENWPAARRSMKNDVYVGREEVGALILPGTGRAFPEDLRTGAGNAIEEGFGRLKRPCAAKDPGRRRDHERMGSGKNRKWWSWMNWEK